MRYAMAAIVTLAALSAPCGAQEPEPPTAVDLPGLRSPMQLQLALQVDGQSPTVACQAFLAQLFEYFDRNQNGQLDRGELDRLLAAQLLGEPAQTWQWPDLAPPKINHLDKSSFVRVCLKRGYSPTVVKVLEPGANDQRLSEVFRRWFVGEFYAGPSDKPHRRAAQTLARFDANEDGAIDQEELLGSIPGFVNAEQASAAPVATNLTARQLPLKVNIAAEQGSIALGNNEAQLKSASHSHAATILDSAGHFVLVVDWRHSMPNMEVAGEFMLAQLAAAMGAKESLSLKSIQQDPALAGLHLLAPLADRNGDGQLTLNELSAYVALIRSALQSRIWITVQDRLGNAWPLADLNGDGRLAHAEMAQLESVWTQHADRSHVPRQIEVSFGAVPARAWGGMQIPAIRPQPKTAAKSSRQGPTWFQALDQNADGIVTEAEFLGPPQAFALLDANSNGVIERNEAD